MPIIPSTQQSHRHKRRLRRTLLVTLAAAAALTAPTAGAAAVDGVGSPALHDKQLIIAVGKGKVSGNLPVCFNGAPGPCGWIVEGTHKGTPIRSGTFFVAIDDGDAASPRRCVPASLSALVYETPDDAIAQTSEGKVCPNGVGGYAFTGRADIAGVSGRFGDVNSGHGWVLITVAPNGSATLTFTGRIRLG